MAMPKITFEEYLKKHDLSPNTISSYLWTANYFNLQYKTVSKESLSSYKEYLIDSFKPKTVNIRIQGINKYLEYLNKDNLKIKCVKLQQKNFLENVISNADYSFFKHRLKKDNRLKWYFIVWYLAATGARISELVQIKIEHIKDGYIDLYGKGGKIRRLFIPKRLCTETLEWVNQENRTDGYLFLNRFGNYMTTRGISQQLIHFANEYGINPRVVHPHSFRHLFAKNFLDKRNDIAMLADLMGHESIETTRIYLKRTAYEQQEIVNSIITW